ncbi:MAG TPA: STAS domain-containing protein, partial [Terrimicrobiaceae bacterium]|nr:STAS domain-containing protein [Terrimicrobiaceae bacterium]
MAITLTSESRGATILLRMTGRLDAHGAAEIEPALRQLDPRGTAVLDLSGVDYLSSAGVRVFVTLFKSLNAQGGRLL